jgi:hypothetical protein
LQRIPAGYLGEFSVYIEPTDLGYASFLSDTIKNPHVINAGGPGTLRAECETVMKQVKGTLYPYPASNAANNDSDAGR